MNNSLGYLDSLSFLENYNNITYPEFDYYSVHKLNLFSSLENIDLDNIENEIKNIENVLPSMKRIFAKPIIHLIDEDEIVPVEAVRLINSKTINYAATHSELWDNISDSGIKPLKLLTNNYKDNYTIYENIVFSRSVDYAINSIKYYSRLLKDMVYNNQKLEINLLEKENHLSYYLALGKLETGHIRSFSKYVDKALNLISRMDFIYSILSARLKRPVYVKCHKIHGNLKLRKTNILSMQKDYRNIYIFLKNIYNNKEIKEFKEDIDDKAYLYYSKYLIIFAIGHFNFEIDKDIKFDFNNLNVNFSFKDYKLNVQDKLIKGIPTILLTFENDLKYQIYLVPSVNEKIKLDIKEEMHILSPNFETNDVFISINNIDSFRRIQQLLLKGMIYSTLNYKICPFCGNELVNENSMYHCVSCHQQINMEYCPTNNKTYLTSSIYKYQLNKESIKSSMLSKRINEGLLHYRNITKITNDLDNICPYCNKVHKN